MDDAVRKRHPGIVELLCRLRKATLPASTSYAVMMCDASAADDVVLVGMLLEAGISPNSCLNDHRTPLHMCTSNSCYKVAERLLRHPQTHVGAVDLLGHTPLWDAIAAGDEKLAGMLYRKGAPLQPNCAAQICQRAADNDCAFLETMLHLNLPVNMRVWHITIIYK